MALVMDAVMATPMSAPAPVPMRPLLAFEVRIVMQDKSAGRYVGLYRNSFDAWEKAETLRPEALRIEVKPLRQRSRRWAE